MAQPRGAKKGLQWLPEYRCVCVCACALSRPVDFLSDGRVSPLVGHPSPSRYQKKELKKAHGDRAGWYIHLCELNNGGPSPS